MQSPFNRTVCGLFIAFSVLSCKSMNRRPAATREEMQVSIDQKFKERHAAFVEVANVNIKFRDLALNYFKENLCKFTESYDCKAAGKPIVFTSSDLDLMYRGMGKYLSLREELLLNYVAPNMALLAKGFSGMENEIVMTDGNFNEEVVLDEYKTPRLRVSYNPIDLQTREFFLKLKYAIAAGLLVYDDFLIGVKPYEENKKMSYRFNADFKARRKILTSYNLCDESGIFEGIKTGPDDRQDVLEMMTDEFYDSCRRNLLSKALSLVMKEWEIRKSDPTIWVSEEEAYVDDLIQKSPFFKTLQEGGAGSDNIQRNLTKLDTRLKWYGRGATYLLSKAFGNIVGLFQDRDGKLKDLSTEKKNAIKANLKAMDILQEKTPFRLTDKFIPGYYGHVAVWIGTEDELKNLHYKDPKTGVVDVVWNLMGHKDAEKREHFQKLIREGHHIIEALRPGVEINTLDHFLDIDDFLAIRDNSLTEQERAKFALRAFDQIGKPYDFNFDVETDDRIVCSEIVYVVYLGYDWPTSNSMGRYTISPDQVAWEADGGCFEPIMMYVDGQKIESDLPLKLSSLINGPEGMKTPDGKPVKQRKSGCHRIPQ